MSEEKVHLFGLFSWPIFGGFERARESEKELREGATECRGRPRCRLQRGESWPQICPTVAGGLLTDCSPPLPCGRSGRGSAFSIPLPLLATQKGNVLQMSGKLWRTAQEELQSSRKKTTWARVWVRQRVQGLLLFYFAQQKLELYNQWETL